MIQESQRRMKIGSPSCVANDRH